MNPSSTHKLDQDQAALWNSTGARGWVEAQEILDRLFQPIANMLLADIRPGENVLDVGCGTGGLSVEAARRAAPGGACTAVDVSLPMIQAAQARSEREATPVTYICADAQSYAFQSAVFDRIISRFGVMFFEDPVRAFANLRAAARSGAELRFVAWRSIEENPFVTTAERAVASVLQLPTRRNDEPGQFALASADRVLGILDQSGWENIEIRPLDLPCGLAEADFLQYLSLIGPVGRHLQQTDDQMRMQVMELINPAFDSYRNDDGVRFNAACWVVTARI
jgi:SAM-dependent methyltransferase